MWFKHAMWNRFFRRLLAFFVGVLCLCFTLHDAHGQEDPLEEGTEAYYAGDYSGAVELLQEVLADADATDEARRQALRYLGRSFIHEGDEDEAREAVRDLLNLEPPPVEFDPDVEPPPLMRLYYELRREQEAADAEDGMQTLAILDFANDSVDERDRYDGLTRGLPSMMISHMSGATGLRVIERERIQWILDELEFQQDAELVDQETAVETGQLLGVHAVVMGSFIVHEDEMTLTARLVEVETGHTPLSEQVSGSANNFSDLIAELSGKLSDALGVEVGAGAGEGETRSLEAIMAYSQGLAAQEEGNYRRAYTEFVRALELDPGYTRAERRAESLRPMIAGPVTSTSLTIGFQNTDFYFAGQGTDTVFDFSSPLFAVTLSSHRGSLTAAYGTSTLTSVATGEEPAFQASQQLLQISGTYGGNAYLAHTIEQAPLAIYVPFRLKGGYQYVNTDDPGVFESELESQHIVDAGLGAGIGSQFRFTDLPGTSGTAVLGNLVLEGSLMFIPAGYANVTDGFDDIYMSRTRDINLEVRLVELLRTGVGSGLGITLGFTHRTIGRAQEQVDSFGDVLSDAFGVGSLDRVSTQRLFRVGINW